MHATTRSTDPAAEKVGFHPMIYVDDTTQLVDYDRVFEDEDAATAVAQERIDSFVTSLVAKGWRHL